MHDERDDSAIVNLDADAWCSEDVDLLSFDHEIHEAEDGAGNITDDKENQGTPTEAGRITDNRLQAHVERGTHIRVRLVGSRDAIGRAEPQVSLRYQRLAPRCNEESATPLFAQLRARHRALHALGKPLVRADYEHAVDVWQWVLRLCPGASFALQAAALFHDVERLQSEADRRVEHHASNYSAFKVEHARKGAAMVREALAGLRLQRESSARIGELVERHERPERDLELRLLNDADSLSFFSLNSPGFLRYYGPEHTARKIRYTLERMSADALGWLPSLRLERGVSALLAHQRR